MIPQNQQASHLLLNKTLPEGWKVMKKLERPDGHTGGVYSACYEVAKGTQKGFLKAFDYSAAEKVSKDRSGSDQIRDILNAYTLERDILDACTSKNCKNVVRLLAKGGIDVEEVSKYPRVEYLILEYAEDGDVRATLEKRRGNHLVWQLRSLHQLCNGLRQIHDLAIAHQDVKPSNIVTLQNGVTKLTDFGSAVYVNGSSPDLPYHVKKDVPGTWAYAPPELLYGNVSDNPITRRIGCDLYLLGSMVVYYFTNSNMTGLIRSNLDDQLSWTDPSTHGNYSQVKPYVELAFEMALQDLGRSIADKKIRDLVLLSVKYLCNPDPELRGHKKTIKEIGPNYSLHRFVTMFDVLATEYEIKYKNGDSCK